MKKYQAPALLAIAASAYFIICAASTPAKARNNYSPYYGYHNYEDVTLTFTLQTTPRPPVKKPKLINKAAPESFPDSYHTVSTTTLNIRSRPSVNSSVVKKLKYKDKVIIIEATDAKWVKVQVGAITGYTLRKSLSLW